MPLTRIPVSILESSFLLPSPLTCHIAGFHDWFGYYVDQVCQAKLKVQARSLRIRRSQWPCSFRHEPMSIRTGGTIKHCKRRVSRISIRAHSDFRTDVAPQLADSDANIWPKPMLQAVRNRCSVEIPHVINTELSVRASHSYCPEACDSKQHQTKHHNCHCAFHSAARSAAAAPRHWRNIQTGRTRGVRCLRWLGRRFM